MSNNPYSGYSNFDQIKLNDNYGKNCHQIGKRRNSKNEIIHSGHFMVSEIDEIEENDKNELESSQPGNDSDQISIDQSLRKLFQCMSLAYDDEKLTSPKWKTFKGLKLNIKDKIRLNNIIWRAWHIQCNYFTCIHNNVCEIFLFKMFLDGGRQFVNSRPMLTPNGIIKRRQFCWKANIGNVASMWLKRNTINGAFIISIYFARKLVPKL